MKKKIYRVVCLTILICLGFWLINFNLKPPKLLSDISFSQAIYDENQHLLRISLTQDEKYRLFIPLSEINADMIQASLLKEDEHFYSHHGINLSSITAAFWQTYIMQGHRRGASTITMQVVRLRYKIKTSTFVGKLKQIFLALQIELNYSKDEILEAYFNLAPYGNNIEGIAAASLIFYHQPVSDLTLPQILTLSIIPQNPSKRTLEFIEYDWIKNSRLDLFKRWVKLFPQDEGLAALMRLPLTNETRKQLPFLAPHFVNVTLQKNKFAKHSFIETTLNLQMQTLIEKKVSAYIAQKQSQGLQNAAAMLVDTNDMSVKAWVGSADFFNKTIQGEVDGILAKRSPGSTLKPFIYGLAIDQGLIHPATVLKDAPTHFGAYTPDNFDNDFLGPITAKSALALSRNIPAIYLASQLHHPSLYDFLLQSGMSLKNERDYGLALVLGGAEITMQHLVELYAMLENRGIYHHLRLMKEDKLDQGKRLLSPEASFLVLDMLQSTPTANRADKIPVSWKTGTSSAFRDAWAVGVFDHYALAVWIGNFSGKGNSAFTGVDAAAPLFFNIVDSLTYEYPIKKKKLTPWHGLNLTQVDICTASGMLPTPACPHKSLSWFIPGVSPIQKDTVYREVRIDPKTGLRVCHFDLAHQVKVYEFWPSDVVKLFQKAGVSRQLPPPYEKNCQLMDKIAQGQGPHMLSPKHSLTYVVTTKSRKILLDAVVDTDVETLHWFVNTTYLGMSKRHQNMLWSAVPGRHTVRVVDDYGRSDSVDILVKEK